LSSADAVRLLHPVPGGADPGRPRSRILGLANSITGLVLVHVVYGLGFTTLFFRNYYEAYPNELIRAAQIDGAGFFRSSGG
jgi:ABC-type glycerol-3-phosphate transport system permease component